MDTVQMHLHLTEEAAKILDKHCTKRGRGALLSELVVAYERQQQLDTYLESLLKQADDVSKRATEAAKMLRAAQKQSAKPR